MIPVCWNMQRKASNDQQDPGFVKGILEEGLFPGGWNSQIETNDKEYYPRPVQSNLQKRENIPGEWNSQKEAANTNIILDMLKTTWERTR